MNNKLHGYQLYDDIDAETIDLIRFSALLDHLMYISICDQLRLGRELDRKYNDWVRSWNQQHPATAQLPLREIGMSQGTISKLLSGTVQPEYRTLRFLVQALHEWFTGEELLDSCRRAGVTPPVFEQWQDDALFKFAGLPLPQEVRAHSQAMREASKSTDKIITVTPDLIEQINAISKSAGKRKRREPTGLQRLTNRTSSKLRRGLNA